VAHETHLLLIALSLALYASEKGPSQQMKELNASTSERVVEGRTSGLMEAGEMVNWAAKHFGVDCSFRS